ncbi:phosphatidylserine/phosphatidylglycerophosphate/cardiolipin synthase family protein, partial [Pseudomonas syringae pv. tagetis]
PLVIDWQAMFNRQFHANARRLAWRPKENLGLDHLPTAPVAGEGLGSVAYADSRHHPDILQSLVRTLNTGQTRIRLATP